MSSAHAWPVILHQSITKTELYSLLKQGTFKLRVSENICTNSVIFPLSGVAFFILLASEISDHAGGQIKPKVIDSINKFVQVHRRCCLLLQAPRHTAREKDVLFALQTRYFQSPLRLLPVHSPVECLQGMLMIAKLVCKPTKEVMTKRFEGVVSQVMTEDYTTSALEKLGLSKLQIQHIEDGIGGLALLAAASRDDMLNCRLDVATADKVTAILK